MSYETERAAIEGRLNTNWTTTKIRFENGKFVPTPGVAWVRCDILQNDTNTLEFGQTSVKEYLGLIDIGIFTPLNAGSKLGIGYADSIKAIFDMVDIGTIDCGPTTIFKVQDEDDWYHIVVSTPFTRRE